LWVIDRAKPGAKIFLRVNWYLIVFARDLITG